MNAYLDELVKPENGLFNGIVNRKKDFAYFYKKRIIEDGGIVESLECVRALDIPDLNWSYNYRVESSGGIVESLECVTI